MNDLQRSGSSRRRKNGTVRMECANHCPKGALKY